MSHDPFEPHTRVRSGDPDTSFEAAESISPLRMTELRRKVLLIFARRIALTDFDLEIICENHGSTYRTRRSELVELGYVADSGQRLMQEGSNRIVWVITDLGQEMAILFVIIRNELKVMT